MLGLFSTVLFASLCGSPFFANILMVVLIVWVFMFFGNAIKK